MRRLREVGAEVRVVMTRSAARFVGPMTFAVLSENKVCLDLFDEKNDAAIRHGLIGIEDEIVNHLGDLPLVDVGRSQIGIDFDVAADIGPAQGELGGFADQIRNDGRASNRLAALGKGEQLLGQLLGPQGRFFHLIQRSQHRVTGLDIEFRKGQVADNAGEEMIEVMDDAAGKHP